MESPKIPAEIIYLKGALHHITIPAHKQLKIGTLGSILADVSLYLELSRDELAKRLFNR